MPKQSAHQLSRPRISSAELVKLMLHPFGILVLIVVNFGIAQLRIGKQFFPGAGYMILAPLLGALCVGVGIVPVAYLTHIVWKKPVWLIPCAVWLIPCAFGLIVSQVFFNRLAQKDVAELSGHLTGQGPTYRARMTATEGGLSGMLLLAVQTSQFLILCLSITLALKKRNMD